MFEVVSLFLCLLVLYCIVLYCLVLSVPSCLVLSCFVCFVLCWFVSLVVFVCLFDCLVVCLFCFVLFRCLVVCLLIALNGECRLVFLFVLFRSSHTPTNTSTAIRSMMSLNKMPLSHWVVASLLLPPLYVSIDAGWIAEENWTLVGWDRCTASGLVIDLLTFGWGKGWWPLANYDPMPPFGTM